MAKRHSSDFQLLTSKKNRVVNVGVVEKPTERHGGVVRVALDWGYDTSGEKTIVFKKSEPHIQAKRTVGIFVAGGATIDKAVREANLKCEVIGKVRTEE